MQGTLRNELSDVVIMHQWRSFYQMTAWPVSKIARLTISPVLVNVGYISWCLQHVETCWRYTDYIEGTPIILKVHRLYWRYTDYIEGTPIILKVHRLYWRYTDYIEGTPIILKVHRLCWRYTDYIEGTPIILKVHPLYWRYTHYIEGTPIILKVRPLYWRYTHEDIQNLIGLWSCSFTSAKSMCGWDKTKNSLTGKYVLGIHNCLIITKIRYSRILLLFYIKHIHIYFNNKGIHEWNGLKVNINKIAMRVCFRYIYTML